MEKEIKVSDFYQDSSFLNVSLCDRINLFGITLTISDTKEVEVKEKRKIGIEFERTPNGKEIPLLLLNRTRAKTMQKAFGDSAIKWLGNQIKLEKIRVMYKGDLVDSIAIIPILQMGAPSGASSGLEAQK